jgi:hypothetical protein
VNRPWYALESHGDRLAVVANVSTSS